jgi:RND family efflux transporter MFP subunit
MFGHLAKNLGMVAVSQGGAMIDRARWILIAAVACCASGCGSSSVATSNAAAPTPAPSATSSQPVTASSISAPLAPEGILSVLSVEHQVDVSTETDGVVVSIAKDEGSEVKAGDVLGQIDDRSLQLDLVKARDDLHVSENNVKYKQAELEAKTSAWTRQKQLRALGLSSDADLETAAFEAKGAEYDLHGYEALVESGQAEIHRIELQIDQTRLHAPFSGAVVGRYVRQGQTVAKGDKCFRVSQLSPLQVQFQVPETSGKRPERGAPVGISLAEDSNDDLPARIVKVSPTIDPASDSYNVTAQLMGGRRNLRPGMAVRVAWPGNLPTNIQ